MNKLLLTFFLAIPLVIAAQQKTHVPDDNFEAFLESYGYGDGIENNDSVWTSAIDTLTVLSVGAFGTYKGIEDFTALEYLACWSLYGLNIDYIDLSFNTELRYLDLSNTIHLPLNLSNNTKLEVFLCAYDPGPISMSNSVESIDVSNNPNLKILVCNKANDLTTLNLRNGNNTNITNLNISNNPNLNCVSVDDVNYSNANWSRDSHTNFSNDCLINEIEETLTLTDKTLIKIVDILGRETKVVRNTLLFYIYKDGTVAKKIIID